MNKKRVFVTRRIPGKAVEMLKEHFNVIVNEEDRPLTRDELLKGVSDVHGVLCQLTDRIDDEVFEAAKSAEIFANYAVGYNNIDIKAAEKRKIIITNTPDVLTNTTAELAWALLFAVSRRIVEADKYTREGKFKMWKPELLLGTDISGKTLGIIGAGRIGKAFAAMSKGFNMKIIYYNRSRDEEFEKELGATYVSMEELIKEADVVSLHVPLTQDTKYLLGEKELNSMKKTAILINTARGPVVDEKALVKALKNKTIAGAGLDVFENEPELEEGLIELDNVVLVPHIGSATKETREKMGIMATENIIRVLKGGEPINPILK